MAGFVCVCVQWKWSWHGSCLLKKEALPGIWQTGAHRQRSRSLLWWICCLPRRPETSDCLPVCCRISFAWLVVESELSEGSGSIPYSDDAICFVCFASRATHWSASLCSEALVRVLSYTKKMVVFFSQTVGCKAGKTQDRCAHAAAWEAGKGGGEFQKFVFFVALADPILESNFGTPKWSPAFALVFEATILGSRILTPEQGPWSKLFFAQAEWCHWWKWEIAVDHQYSIWTNAVSHTTWRASLGQSWEHARWAAFAHKTSLDSATAGAISPIFLQFVATRLFLTFCRKSYSAIASDLRSAFWQKSDQLYQVIFSFGGKNLLGITDSWWGNMSSCCVKPWVMLWRRAVFLVVDMAFCHIHPSIPAFARRRGLRMILVPAGLTCVLQPLDTHVFRSFRSKLQQLWLIHKSRNEGGEVSLQDWLLLVCKTIEEVVCGQEWEHAFERDGLVHAQALVSPKLLASLGWEDLPTIGAGLPSIGQAARMFPHRSKANVPMWVQWTAPEAFVRIRTLDWKQELYSVGRSTPRFYREGWLRANEICVSLQFWAIDDAFLEKGLLSSWPSPSRPAE